MQLTPRQRRALEAICDTFAPGGDGWPSAPQLGVPAAILASLDSHPREAEQNQIRRLLSFWETSLHSLLAGESPRRFSSLPLAARQKILLDWCDSRMPQRRQSHDLHRGHRLPLRLGPGRAVVTSLESVIQLANPG